MHLDQAMSLDVQHKSHVPQLDVVPNSPKAQLTAQFPGEIHPKMDLKKKTRSFDMWSHAKLASHNKIQRRHFGQSRTCSHKLGPISNRFALVLENRFLLKAFLSLKDWHCYTMRLFLLKSLKVSLENGQLSISGKIRWCSPVWRKITSWSLFCQSRLMTRTNISLTLPCLTKKKPGRHSQWRKMSKFHLHTLSKLHITLHRWRTGFFPFHN